MEDQPNKPHKISRQTAKQTQTMNRMTDNNLCKVKYLGRSDGTQRNIKISTQTPT